MEIDLFDASQKPVKCTDLGRIKHKAITIAESANG
jgi:secreted PhoX family phosphatase